MRRFIVWSVGGAAVVATLTAGFQFLRFLPMDLRFAHVGLKGSRITIDSPKLVGYRKDGRPYELQARAGAQDMATPDLFELEGLEVRLDGGADNVVRLNAKFGIYDSKNDLADLSGGVRIFDEKSYDLGLISAQLNLKASRLTSDRHATLKLKGGEEVEGDSIELDQSEQRVTFIGAVHSVMRGDEGEAAPEKP